MKNKFLFLILGMLLLIGVVSATYCCEVTTEGAYCQNVDDAKECGAGGDASTACSETTYCKVGTCINVITGECYDSTYAACKANGGEWDERDEEDIEMCRKGCCIYGESKTYTAYSTYTGCKELSTDYSISLSEFRTDLTQTECTNLNLNKEVGACVYESNYSKDCDSYVTYEECTANEGDFYPEFLCTANGLSDCAVSEETMCYNEKVYFQDTCGERANIYDKKMFDKNENSWDNEMKSYWEKIQDPTCEVNAGDDSCGDCSYIEGTSCSETSSGKHVCEDLGCTYEGIYYDHGESWCAESEGTYPHLPLYLIYDSSNNDLSENEKNKIEIVREELKDDGKYNLPGSRYVRLRCWEGEVFVENCADYRSEICVEGELVEGYNYSQCVTNPAPNCKAIGTKTECESTSNLCKWIPGYRYDGENVNPKAYGDNEYNYEEQGTCAPLIPTGLNFFNEEDSSTYGQNYCNLGGSVTEYVQYETSWTKNTRDDILELDYYGKIKLRANRCYDNCYAIPEYGNEYSLGEINDETGMMEVDEKLIQFVTKDGYELDEKPEDVHISDRRGYYCTDATGQVVGDEFSCAVLDKNEKKNRNQIPIYYTNEQWFASITERTDALGDCGYKETFVGLEGDIGSEKIIATFQKLNQKGKVKDEGETMLLWAGNAWFKKALESFSEGYDGIVREGEAENITQYQYTDEEGDTYWNFD